MKSRITVGTRGSKLALTQANMVISALKQLHAGLEIDLKIITTTGDKILDKELSKIGGKGLFIKEIEESLSNKEIDFAVHSLKDVPHTLPEGFCIAAILEREDPRDVLISKNDFLPENMPAGSVIGTSSLRRMLQIKDIRPDLECKSIRGNIDTRIKKLAKGDFDAIVLAAAGIKRMGWSKQSSSKFFAQFVNQDSETDLKVNYLNVDNFIPSVGQGALAIEIRENDNEIFDIVRVLNNDTDEKCVIAERAFLKEIDGGCEIPIGAYCREYDNKINIIGFIGDEKTFKIYKDEVNGSINENNALGVQLAKNVLSLKNKCSRG